MLWNLPYIVVVAITMIGLVTILYKKNLIKVLLGINILQSAANLFLISLGYRAGAVAPIYSLAPSTWMVLPTPQALCLTSIVIGVATSALLLSFAIIIHKKYGPCCKRYGMDGRNNGSWWPFNRTVIPARGIYLMILCRFYQVQTFCYYWKSMQPVRPLLPGPMDRVYVRP